VVDEHMKKEEHDAALAQVNDAIQLMPEQSAWWYSQKMRALVAKSDAWFHQNRLLAAIPPLQEAGNLPIVDAKPMTNPKIRGIAMRLGGAAMRAGDWTDAIGHFEMAAGIDDRDPLVFELRAQCYEQKQLWRQAAGDYEVLATLIPERKADLLEKAKTTRAKFKPSDANGPRD
jgi:tetratricopeptide (TPR) repeat protein